MDDLDHIVPHKEVWALFWDPTNWQGLCDGCHSFKTATEDGGFGRKCSGVNV
jgi:5-methylcytosine-specific restriction protein A